jgi:hypothetical protein
MRPDAHTNGSPTASMPPDQQQIPNQHSWTGSQVSRHVVIPLAIGLVAIVVVIAAVLARSPLVVVGTNSVSAKVNLELEKGDIGSCQPSGTIPRGTSAIRVAMEARAVGPMVTLKVLSGSRILTEGRQSAGWGAASSVMVSIDALAHTFENAHICTTIGPTVEPVRVRGTPRGLLAADIRKLQDVTLRMEYLRPSRKSWWSLGSSVAYHMGLGRAPSGTWVAFLVPALMLAIAILASRLVLKELR